MLMHGEAAPAGDLPTLDAFDEEFGREPSNAVQEQPRRLSARVLVGLLLAAAIISVPALAWLNADALPARSGSMSPQSHNRADPEGEIDRLVREVTALKHEIAVLTAAQQQATALIASLQSAGQQPQSAPAYWWSDLAVLNFGGVSESPAETALAARRAVTAREPRPREPSAPLSLEPPQQ